MQADPTTPSSEGVPSIVAGGSARSRRSLQHLADRSWEEYLRLKDATRHDVRTRFTDLRTSLTGVGTRFALPEDVCVSALALSARACDLALGLPPHPTQFLGAVILIAGDVAQLDTGEGKTLVGALAASALALPGRGVHVVTANEFLAERDSQWFSPVYSTLGLTVGLSREGSNLAARRAAHAADVTYATALSLGLDFLHGDLALDAADVATRPPFAAVIDEVDAVLLDDARLPIAISITDRVQSRPFARFALAVSDLEQGRDVYVDLSTDTISLLPSGLSKVQERLGVSNLYDNHTSAAHVQLALRSRFSLTEGREFVVAPDSTGRSSAVLVDPVTSLARPHARMRDGLHEALEARLGLDVSPSAQVRASTTVNGVFSRYEILAGMGGTASNAAADLRELYDMKVYTIPPHRPSQRRDHPARYFSTSAERDQAFWSETLARLAKGQPVLAVCGDTAEVARLQGSAPAGVDMRAVTADRPGEEAAVLSRAGEPAAVTIVTVFAGRGVDVILGGIPSEEGFTAASASVRAAGGLCVISLARFSSSRLDAQARGRCARQGQPGETLSLLSFEDELPSRFAPAETRNLLAGNDNVIPGPLAANVFNKAQHALESEHAASRRSLLLYSRSLELHRREFQSFRSKLLALPAWSRAVSVMDLALKERSTNPDLAAVFAKLFPSEGSLQGVLARIESGLSSLHSAPQEDRPDILRWSLGDPLLDMLDASWAAHLEAGAFLERDVRLLSRFGQRPEVVYESLLARSFQRMFAHFLLSATRYMGALRLNVAAPTVD